MKHIVAINASPRPQWNTGTLIREAARGAQAAGAEVSVIDLYRIGPFSGCVSCFGCKRPEHKGVCVYRDALSPVLEEIRHADGLILGAPNYLGDVSAGFRALYERLIFQSLTYKAEFRSYNTRKIPVLFLMTSNAREEDYPALGYDKTVQNYQNVLTNFVGPTRTMICGNTLQVSNYQPYEWTIFDAEAKQRRHQEVFPQEKEHAAQLGAEMVLHPWTEV